MKTLKDKTESELIGLCKDGDEDAFNELIERSGDKIRNYINKLSRDNYDVTSDIFQITMIKCWQKIAQFKEKCKFSSWASNIGRNAFYDYQRGKKDFHDIYMVEGAIKSGTNNKQENPFELLPDFPLVEETLPNHGLVREDDKTHAKKTTRNILDKLKPDFREILRLRDRDGLEYAEIAKILKIPIGTVMSRIYYARKNVITIIKKYKYEIQK